MQRCPRTAGRVRRSEAPLRKTEVCNAYISDPPLFVGHPPKRGGPTSGARDALSGMVRLSPKCGEIKSTSGINDIKAMAGSHF
jgi:hypothetical protein